MTGLSSARTPEQVVEDFRRAETTLTATDQRLVAEMLDTYKSRAEYLQKELDTLRAGGSDARITELLADNTRLELARREATAEALAARTTLATVERQRDDLTSVLAYRTPDPRSFTKVDPFTPSNG